MKIVFKGASFLLLAFWSLAAWSASPMSQARLPGENWHDAAARAMRTLGLDAAALPGSTAYDARTPLNEIHLTGVPSWENESVMNRRFEAVRDFRFLKSGEHPNFLRRITWLYPDDGCPVRASYVGQVFQDQNVTRPAKVFAFGDLAVETDNSPDGIVQWWYHVAPLIVVDGKPYVLDPSIHPSAPLSLREWLESMGDSSAIEVAICNAYTFSPDSSCLKAPASEDNYAKQLGSYFLSEEWSRQSYLGRNPTDVLGEHPPWMGKP